MPIKSFRGLIEDDTQQAISLHTSNGSTGYKIVKFDLMPPSPGVTGQESVVKIYKIQQTAVDGTIDFSDNTLIGAAFVSSITGNPSVHPETVSVIFDNEIFNQDIFITSKDARTVNDPINYYLELEVIPLDDAGAEYTTLKDMRQS